MSEATRESLLPGAAGCSLHEETGLAWFDVRGDARNPELVRHVQRTAGCLLPLHPNSLTRETGTAFWMGPDQWLLAVARTDAADLETRLLVHPDLPMAANDVTSAHRLFTVSGTRADTILRSGTSFDITLLDERRCAQTLLAKAQVLIWRPAAGTYHLLVRRSFASYLWRWLADAVDVWGGC